MSQNLFSTLMLVFFIAMIYFLMIRPQKKKEKEDKAMREGLKVGDQIMTIGGVMGKIVKINERSVVITTGAEKTKIEFVKTAVASVSNNGDPNTGAKQSAKKTANKSEDAQEKTPDRDKKIAPKKLGHKKEEVKEGIKTEETLAEEQKVSSDK